MLATPPFGAALEEGVRAHDPRFPGSQDILLISDGDDPQDDREWLRHTVARHLKETGSAVAERLLGNWDSEVEWFNKVMPKDYKRVLTAAKRAEEQGISVDEAVMAAAHG